MEWHSREHFLDWSGINVNVNVRWQREEAVNRRSSVKQRWWWIRSAEWLLYSILLISWDFKHPLNDLLQIFTDVFTVNKSWHLVGFCFQTLYITVVIKPLTKSKLRGYNWCWPIFSVLSLGSSRQEKICRVQNTRRPTLPALPHLSPGVFWDRLQEPPPPQMLVKK